MHDHKAILAQHVAVRLGRRSVLKGMGAGLFAATAGAALPATAQVAQSGHLRVGAITPIDTLDPHFTFRLGSVQIISNICNGLLKVVYDGTTVSFEPDLAATWELEDDRTHAFTLHPNVMFHDGTPCDAEAVRFNLMRVKSGTPASPHGWKLEKLEEVEIIDAVTFKLHFSEPYAFLPVALTGSIGRAGTIVSPTAVETFGEEFGRNPVGTGPFKFVSWEQNNSIELVANEDYFMEGLPKLERVSFMLIDEPSTALAALISGQIDAMNDCPMQLTQQVMAMPNLTMYGRVEGNYTYVGMNTQRAPFDDVNLRRAVAYAIDRNAVLQQAYFGLAKQAFSPISPPMSGFYDENIADSGRGQFYDLEKAKEFRALAANQEVIEVTYLMTENPPAGTRVAQIVAPLLAEIGIKVNLELLENAAWTQRLQDRDFEMVDFFWTADLDPDETLFPEFRTDGAWNYWGWSNAEFDSLCTQAQVVLDVAERSRLYNQAEDIMLAEAPIAMLAHFPLYKVFSNRVQGFNYVPCDLMNLDTVSFT
ncbi:peptide/nickel transport system substrate-binding protein [Loktanella fryxellensis]|uniref:Peptide/nickel transport system substrate-binding protein n=1 Tax=Loktanella fryxellensis TaxID=245187 RepID=A0A1H8BW01_9RHOB|nr:ABC transporter substrate-binding protein [Loktanella fryxellensis]SEM86047.1 peptide/nickel transport system substrate-binding protein [Loktanella fryxellensis]